MSDDDRNWLQRAGGWVRENPLDAALTASMFVPGLGVVGTTARGARAAAAAGSAARGAGGLRRTAAMTQTSIPGAQVAERAGRGIAGATRADPGFRSRGSAAMEGWRRGRDAQRQFTQSLGTTQRYGTMGARGAGALAGVRTVMGGDTGTDEMPAGAQPLPGGLGLQDGGAGGDQGVDGVSVALAQAEGERQRLAGQLEDQFEREAAALRDRYEFAETEQERAMLDWLIRDLDAQRTAGHEAIGQMYGQTTETQRQLADEQRAATEASAARVGDVYRDAAAAVAGDTADPNAGIGSGQADALGLDAAPVTPGATDYIADLEAAGAREQTHSERLGDLTADDLAWLAQSSQQQQAAQQGELARAVANQQGAATAAHQQQVANRIAQERAAYQQAAAGLEGDYRGMQQQLTTGGLNELETLAQMEMELEQQQRMAEMEQGMAGGGPTLGDVGATAQPLRQRLGDVAAAPPQETAQGVAMPGNAAAWLNSAIGSAPADFEQAQAYWLTQLQTMAEHDPASYTWLAEHAPDLMDATELTHLSMGG